MNDPNNLCKGCMKHSAVNGKCPECGFDEAKYEVMPHHLKPGTILAGKYMIGKVLGEGGFGITYIGIDLNLNLRVAIKEYFPAGCVTRDTRSVDTVTVFSGDMRTFFEHGRKKFIEEARTIAQFNDSEGVVSVKDFFLENGTAYIVMEYLDGETLKSFLARNGGKMKTSDALNMIKPVLRSLIQLHKSGLIHRDISPDNIMITKTGKVKLIDFGAARDINPQGNRSLSIQLKPGYAPEEQYRTHGNQGPWTDVYALCATIYRMITGIVPVEANERMINDTLVPPSALGTDINPNIENALMKGLGISAQSRVQSISELYDAFYKGVFINTEYPPRTGTVPNRNVPQPDRRGPGAGMIALIIILAAMAVAIAVITVSVALSSTEESAPPAPTEAIATPAPTEAPTPVPATPAPARTDLYSAELEYKRMPDIHSSHLVSDAEFDALKAAILDFDAKCVEYMNNGSTDVFMYLNEGTTAYDQQTSYKAKHENIHEVLNSADVINARYDGRSYYVWVTESMTVTENGETSNTVDHWVYRIDISDGRYIIADYTRDPAYS